MSIFKRISDIISANLNDMVETYENPEQMLRQAVREMEEAIAKARPDVAKAMANDKLLAKELAVNEAECQNWSTRATAAVEAGDDGLARKALGRKREYEKIVAALRDQQAASLDATQTLRRQLDAMQSKLAEARRQLGTLTARNKAAEVRGKMAKAQLGVGTETNQEAFEKFERLSRKVEQAEAEAEAMAELAKDQNPAAAEPDAAEPEVSSEQLEIDAELALLKSQRKGQK
jgi:phage shock protein A